MRERKRGTGNEERGTGNGERGTANGERGTGNGERGMANEERGTGNEERRTGNGIGNGKRKRGMKTRNRNGQSLKRVSFFGELPALSRPNSFLG